ncbi:EAL domain-containing protein [Celerinatantimonas sp. MCCC 1A17872]|uniref:EAL domain-containing protein n=1 Tax=Celerinatantimonas sp. MCCC 1A17872 TaxID=3177514 RepID=UPI0038CAA9AC
MKLFRTVCFLLGCLWGSYIPQATAQVVRIGFSSDSPVNYVRQQHVNGYLVNYIKKLLPSRKVSWIAFHNADAGIRALSLQHIDLWLTPSENDPQWVSSDDLFQEHWGLITLSGQPHPQSLEKLSALKLGIQDSAIEHLSEKSFLGQTVMFPSWNGGVKLLENHLVEGVLMPRHIFKKFALLNSNIEYYRLPLWRDYRLSALKFTPGANWIRQINRNINADDLTLDHHQPSTSEHQWLLVSALVICILLLVCLCWIIYRYYRLRRQLPKSFLVATDFLKSENQLHRDIARWLQTEQSLGIFMFEFSRQIELYESYGLETGQRLLRVFACNCRKQLKKLYPGSELYCWQDNYFVLLSGKTPHSYQQMAQQIAQTCRGWVNVDGLKLRLRSHVGWTDNSSLRISVNSEVLLGEAYLALRQAIVHQQRNCVYLDEQRSCSRARLALEAKLRQAIDSNELTLFVQPQFSLTVPRKLVGAEVLVRWFTPDGKFISPAQFIPIAEQTGLIARLDHWVCEHSVAMLAKYQSLLPEDFRLSVNFSAVSISRGLCEKLVLDSIQRWHVPPRKLCLEITESAIMNSLVAARQSIARLRQQGFDIAIDDFGTGYSSMAYLKNLAVTHLKIDQVFTAGLEKGISDQQIVRAIAMVGKSFGHHILIEGVEQAKQATLARQLGCQFVQGFHYAKPMAWMDFVRQYLGENRLTPALESI